MRIETFDRQWVLEKDDDRQDVVMAINKKRIQEAETFREFLHNGGYPPCKYEIKIRHHPCGDLEDGSTVGLMTASVIPRE